MNKQRRNRIAEALELISQARDILEEVKDEEQESYENLPESLQYGERGEQMQAKKARRWYFIKQKAYGLAMLAVTVLAAWATEGDITIAVITVPLGLMCLFSKKMLIVDNYYFATEERAIHGRKNNTAY